MGVILFNIKFPEYITEFHNNKYASIKKGVRLPFILFFDFDNCVL